MATNLFNHRQEDDIIYLENKDPLKDSSQLNGDEEEPCENNKSNFEENGQLTKIFITDSRLLDVLGFVLQREVDLDGHQSDVPHNSKDKKDNNCKKHYEYYIFSLEVGTNSINSFVKLSSSCEEKITWPDAGHWPVLVRHQPTDLSFYNNASSVSVKAFNMLACLGSQLKEVPLDLGIEILLSYVSQPVDLDKSPDAISVREQLIPLMDQLKEKHQVVPLTEDHLKLICKDNLTLYENCHYFMMRLVNGDLEGAQYLGTRFLPLDDHTTRFIQDAAEDPFVLLRSQVDIVPSQYNDLTSVVCHCICDSKYTGTEAVKMNLLLSDKEIIDHSEPAEMEIDQCQVDFALGNKSLRCSYGQIFALTDDGYVPAYGLGNAVYNEINQTVQKAVLDIFPTAQNISYGHSLTYISYAPHNQYLDKPVYNISDDVLCRIMITDFGEFVIFCQNIEDLLFYKMHMHMSIDVITEGHLKISLPPAMSIKDSEFDWTKFTIPAHAVDVYNNVFYGNIYVEPAPFKDFVGFWSRD